MKLVILTKSPEGNFLSGEVFKIAVKSLVKFLFGQKRGPRVVMESLLRGLRELNYSFLLNPSSSAIDFDDVVLVNESLAALRWGIKAKKAGRIKKLIAGPNLVVAPTDAGGVLMDDCIDLVLVPSEWVKNFYATFKPNWEPKIQAWAAGLVIPASPSAERDLCLVYKKTVDKNLFEQIINFLSSQSIKYKVIRYGHYRRSHYFKLLTRSQCLIYLQETESQGMALAEAWMRGVPTLVWNRGYWDYAGHYWKDEKAGAPYLSDACGMFFKDADDFKRQWSVFKSKISGYAPRDYAIKNFSNEIAAKNFLNLAGLD